MFIVVFIAFHTYDLLVTRRNNKVVENAAKSNAVVSSMFPDIFRDKVIEKANAPRKKTHGEKSLANSEEKENDIMADLFLETTVLRADITGFPAWASVREPHQVFILLETIYSEFDRIAKSQGIFKVETVGECYVGKTMSAGSRTRGFV